MHGARALHIVQITAQPQDLVVQHPPVCFELAFTGARQEAATAPLALKVGPGPHQSRPLVKEAGQFDLKTALLGPGAQAKYFEDQACSVDDLHFKLSLEVALLNRCQVTVYDGYGAIILAEVFGQSIKNTSRQQDRRIHFANMFSAQEGQITAKRFHEACRFLQTVFGGSVCRCKPRDNHASHLGHWRAINHPVSQNGLVRIHFLIKQLHRGAWSNCRDGVLVDKLWWASVTAKQNTEIVKPSHHTLKFNAIDQEDCQGGPGLPDGIQEGVLQILFFVGGHDGNPIWPVLVMCRANGITASVQVRTAVTPSKS